MWSNVFISTKNLYLLSFDKNHLLQELEELEFWVVTWVWSQLEAPKLHAITAPLKMTPFLNWSLSHNPIHAWLLKIAVLLHHFSIIESNQLQGIMLRDCPIDLYPTCSISYISRNWTHTKTIFKINSISCL